MPLGATKNAPTANSAARWVKRIGLALDRSATDYSMDVDYEDLFANSNGAPTYDIAGQGAQLGSDGNVYQKFGGETMNPMKKTITFNLATNGSLGTVPFFQADQTYLLWGVTEIHGTAATTAGTVTAQVTIDQSGAVPGSGVSVMSSTFNLKGVAATLQTATMATTPAAGLTQQSTNGIAATPIIIQQGQRLTFVPSTVTLTSLAAVQLTITVTPQGNAPMATYFAGVNGDQGTTTFYVAPRPMVIQAVWLSFGTAFAAAVTVDVTHETGTTASGSGSSILSAAVAADGTGQAINVPTSLTLTATASRLTMAPGDRLSIKPSATTTGANVILTVIFSPLVNEKQITWYCLPNAQQATAQYIFTADRPYEVVDAAEVHGTAAGGAQVMTITIDRTTGAPGSGTSVDSTGFNLNSTAATTQFGDSGNAALSGIRSNRLLGIGDRLGIHFSGAAQASANVCATVVLKAA